MKHPLNEFRKAYEHLSKARQKQIKPWHTLALHIEKVYPDGIDKTTMLVRLLESKDSAMAYMDQNPEGD